MAKILILSSQVKEKLIKKFLFLLVTPDTEFVDLRFFEESVMNDRQIKRWAKNKNCRAPFEAIQNFKRVLYEISENKVSEIWADEGSISKMKEKTKDVLMSPFEKLHTLCEQQSVVIKYFDEKSKSLEYCDFSEN